MSSNVEYLVKEKYTLNRSKYDQAEKAHYCKLTVDLQKKPIDHGAEISQEFNKVRQQLRDQLNSNSSENEVHVNDLLTRLNKLELENTELKSKLQHLESRLAQLEKPGNVSAPQKPTFASVVQSKPAVVEVKKEEKKKDDDDDEVDLFGDDDEEDQAEQERIKAERVAAYEAKKSKKPALVAKSSVMLDVKPWDDETDMKALEESVRSIEMDGLLWGSSKLVPIAFGIKKLQITCVIEDDKVSTEELDEKICAFEDFIQSVDIASFNKI